MSALGKSTEYTGLKFWHDGVVVGISSRGHFGSGSQEGHFFATVTWSYPPLRNYHEKKLRITGSDGLDRMAELVAVEDKMQASKANFLLD